MHSAAAGKPLNWGQSPIQGWLGEEQENRGLSLIFQGYAGFQCSNAGLTIERSPEVAKRIPGRHHSTEFGAWGFVELCGVSEPRNPLRSFRATLALPCCNDARRMNMANFEFHADDCRW